MGREPPRANGEEYGSCPEWAQRNFLRHGTQRRKEGGGECAAKAAPKLPCHGVPREGNELQQPLRYWEKSQQRGVPQKMLLPE